MFSAFYLWILSLGSHVCALVMCAWVLKRLFGLTGSEQVSRRRARIALATNRQARRRSVSRTKTRLDAPRKAPAAVNVVSEIKGRNEPIMGRVRVGWRGRNARRPTRQRRLR